MGIDKNAPTPAHACFLGPFPSNQEFQKGAAQPRVARRKQGAGGGLAPPDSML